MDNYQDRKISRLIIECDIENGSINIKDNDDVVLHYDVTSRDASNIAQDTAYYLLNQIKKKYHNQYVDNFLKRKDTQEFIDHLI